MGDFIFGLSASIQESKGILWRIYFCNLAIFSPQVGKMAPALGNTYKYYENLKINVDFQFRRISRENNIFQMSSSPDR